NDDDSFLMYVVKVPPPMRESIRAAMAADGVATSVHYPSLARHPLLGNGIPGALCSDEDAKLMTLPTFLELGPDEQGRVADAFARALETARATSADRTATSTA